MEASLFLSSSFEKIEQKIPRWNHCSLRERIRARIEDLASLSRRSLFGRLVRMPSLLPFKRQQVDELEPGAGGARGARRARPGSLLARRRKRRREADRQMISINGKQYYVDDEGELKPLPEDNKQAAAS